MSGSRHEELCCVQMKETLAWILFQNSRPGLPYTELVIVLPGDFCVNFFFLFSFFYKKFGIWRCGIHMGFCPPLFIVKIVILKIILVTGNLVCSEAADLQRHSLQSPGSCHSGAYILGHLVWSTAVQSVNKLRLLDGIHNADPWSYFV